MTSFPASDFEGDALERIGLRLYRPPLDPVFSTIVAGSPAERAIRYSLTITYLSSQITDRCDS